MVLAYVGVFFFALGVGNNKTPSTVLGFVLTLGAAVDLYLQVTQKEKSQ